MPFLVEFASALVRGDCHLVNHIQRVRKLLGCSLSTQFHHPRSSPHAYFAYHVLLAYVAGGHCVSRLLDNAQMIGRYTNALFNPVCQSGPAHSCYCDERYGLTAGGLPVVLCCVECSG